MTNLQTLLSCVILHYSEIWGAHQSLRRFPGVLVFVNCNQHFSLQFFPVDLELLDIVQLINLLLRCFYRQFFSPIGALNIKICALKIFLLFSAKLGPRFGLIMPISLLSFLEFPVLPVLLSWPQFSNGIHLWSVLLSFCFVSVNFFVQFMIFLRCYIALSMFFLFNDDSIKVVFPSD